MGDNIIMVHHFIVFSGVDDHRIMVHRAVCFLYG